MIKWPIFVLLVAMGHEGRLVAAADSAAEVYEAKEKTGFPQTLVTYIEEPLRPKDAE